MLFRSLTLDELLTARGNGIELCVIAVLDSSAGADALMARPGLEHLKALAGQRIGAEDSASGALMLGMGAYRLFIIATCVSLAVGLQAVLAKSRFGSRLRAAVDDPRVAAGLGIPVDRVFLLTFAMGSGLAGLGGALGADLLGMEPSFPLKYMVYFLIVCAVGGTSSITGPLLAALLLGCADVLGKYYVPKLGAFIVYALMIAILLWRPQGLFTREKR